MTVPTLERYLTLNDMKETVKRSFDVVKESAVFLRQDNVNEAVLAQALAEVGGVRSEADFYENLLRCNAETAQKEKLLAKGLTEAEVDRLLREYNTIASPPDEGESAGTSGEEPGSIGAKTATPEAPPADVVPPATDIKKPPGPVGPVTPPAEKPGSKGPESATPPPGEREPLQLKDPRTAGYESGTGVSESPGGGGGGGGGGGTGGGGGGSAGTVPLSEEDKDKVEKCGRLFAQRLLEDPKLGYIVEQMPPENPGFDLKATREGEELRVEVKAHLRKATVVDDLTARQYNEYVGSKTKGAEYKWQLWNIENLKDDAGKVLITRYDDIPEEALDAKLFKVDLKKCIPAQ